MSRQAEQELFSAMPTDAVYFSPRQREIMKLVASGWTNLEIADSLGIAVGTVKFHLDAGAGKIGVRRRVLIARWWWERYG
jgi:DNA-binding CsgD family transcriptional regulator